MACGANAVFVHPNLYPNLYKDAAHVLPQDNSGATTWTDIAGDTYIDIPMVASRSDADGRVTRGTIDDYWVSYESTEPDPYITNGWPQHAWGDAVGDYMYTSQSAFGNIDGETQFYIYQDTSDASAIQSSSDPYTCDVMSSRSNPDGTLGLKLLKRSPCYVIAQDEASSIVFGMAKEAIAAGVVDVVVSVEKIAAEIRQAFQGPGP